ncbi:hypothetical protein [Pyrobaculum aerophilum]|nr:hypothetical protein [Pyrobaculum aerophilum]MCX8135715.1 hypothetical protein [Pyrobaculum aerophilum]
MYLRRRPFIKNSQRDMDPRKNIWVKILRKKQDPVYQVEYY